MENPQHLLLLRCILYTGHVFIGCLNFELAQLWSQNLKETVVKCQKFGKDLEMISKVGIRIISVLITAGSIGGFTRFEWNEKQHRIILTKSIIKETHYWITFVLAIVAVPIVLIDYSIQLDQMGFQLDDDKNIFKFFYCCVGAALYIFEYFVFFRQADLALIINQFLEFLKSLPEKYHMKSTERYNLITPLYLALLAAGFTMPGLIAMIYLLRCELHPFYYVFPIVCGVDAHLIMNIIIKCIAASVVWSLGTTAFATGLIVIYPSILFWFYGLEISQTMKKLNFHSEAKRREDLYQIFRTLEVLKFRIVDLNGAWVLPGLFVVLMAMYLLSFNAIIKGHMGIMTTMGLIDVIFIFFIYFTALQISWKFSETISYLLDKCSLDISSIFQKKLLGCSPLSLRFGNFAQLNRKLYIFLADLVINTTINILLM